MKPMVGIQGVCENAKQKIPLPPPLPPRPRFLDSPKLGTESVTKQEIARFWKKKRIEEEDHLLAAIKAAARIRARNFTEEDYKSFVESLKDDDSDDKNSKAKAINVEKEEKNLYVGIKDWWTKSKYAYLNQPPIQSMDLDASKKRTSTYSPNCFTYKPTPLYPTSLGVF